MEFHAVSIENVFHGNSTWAKTYETQWRLHGILLKTFSTVFP